MRVEALIEEQAAMSARRLATRELVLERMREDEQLRARTHEHPDGDALGSLVGDAGAADRARQGLRDVHRARRSAAAPTSTASLPLDRLIHEPPADIAERTVVFLDCGNIDRNPARVLRDGATC